jgi:parallel beta-helix repeat protein
MKTNYRRIVLICTAIIIGCIATLSATERWGVLQKDERWTPENSPYFITDDLLIPAGTRLAISPGTHIMVGRPTRYIDGISQADQLDSFTISITVRGIISCVGTPKKPIIFKSQKPDANQCSWYGIVCENLTPGLSEFAYVTVAGACNGLTLRASAPTIRNSVFEYNNVGILCLDGSSARIQNCVLASNNAGGIRIVKSNPLLYNNIITSNSANGVWSDGTSRITFEYNCIFGNGDGDLLGCDPQFGILTKANKHKDSTDFKGNIFRDPVFQGSVAESLSVEQDVSLPTDKSRLKDTTLAKVLTGTLTDSTAHRRRAGSYQRYTLSSYSPCIDAGNPQKPYNDDDGTRNDMGIWGGPAQYGTSRKK